MEHSEQLNELAAALVKAQAIIEGAAKDSTNPFFKSKYADLFSVWNAVRKPLTDNGLSVVQMPGVFDSQGNLASLDTLLLHESGQWIKSTLQTPVGAKVDPQGVGSAITYMRRYALMSATSVTPEDDDGESTVDRATKEKVTKANPRPVVGAPKSGAGMLMPFGDDKGTPLRDFDNAKLQKLRAWCVDKDENKFTNLIAGIDAVFAEPTK